MLKASDRIRGIKVHDTEIRISQYADDTILYLNGERGNVDGALQEVETFSSMSGLQLNKRKTKCLRIGPIYENSGDEEPQTVNWVKELKY